MTAGNPWDDLAPIFAAGGDEEDVPPAAADNILIAWPPMLRLLTDTLTPGPTRRVLDFGCGGGRFARELSRRGYDVIGVDSSAVMIQHAEHAYGRNVSFHVGGWERLAHLPKVSAVTSVMTLPFIEQAADALRAFADALDANGLLIIAAHNPDYVDAWIARGERYVDFGCPRASRHGILRFDDGTAVPIYVRDATEYNEMASAAGLEPVFECRPPFTEEFITRYTWGGPTNHPEYLILGYRRQARTA